jgi:hypothetical protein
MTLRCCVAVLLFSSLLPAQGHERTMTAGVVGLEVDGKMVPISKCSGGEAVADVATQGAHKQISNTHCEPLVVEVDPALVMPWISDMMAGKGKPLNFSVVRAGADRKVHSRTQMVNALLTQVEFMALDAESKAPFSCTLTFQPERAQEDGKVGDVLPGEPKAKRAMAGTFRVSLSGQDLPVMKVGPITARAGSAAGAGKRVTAGGLEVGNLTLTVGESGAGALLSWYKAAVVEGKNRETKDVVVELSGPDMKTSLLKLEAKGVGIIAARRQYAAADARQEIAFEAFVEQWLLSQ